LKLKTNIGTKLNHFDTWHNGEMTRVKNKKIQKKNQKILKNFKKNQKLTRGINLNTVWSKLTVKTKLNHF